MADNVVSVTDNSFESEVIEASNTQPVMVDFWADWCRPCHMLAPTVAEIATDYTGRLKVVKMNVDENVNAAGHFDIRGIPTLLIFKGGQVADQIVGAVQRNRSRKWWTATCNNRSAWLNPRLDRVTAAVASRLVLATWGSRSIL